MPKLQPVCATTGMVARPPLWQEQRRTSPHANVSAGGSASDRSHGGVAASPKMATLPIHPSPYELARRDQYDSHGQQETRPPQQHGVSDLAERDKQQLQQRCEGIASARRSQVDCGHGEEKRQRARTNAEDAQGTQPGP